MNKKLFLLSVFFAFIVTSSNFFAQITVNPQDDFYTYAQGWELKGYVKSLPQLRPYPLNIVKSILSSVIENGATRDIEIAQNYWEKITGKPYTFSLEGGVRQRIDIDTFKNTGISEGDKHETNKKRQYAVSPYLSGDIGINPLASFGYNFGIYTVNKDDQEVLPLFFRSEHDTVSDATEAGSFRMNIDMNSNLAVGKENLYLQAGINRSGFGPFLKDDLALSDNAFHAPNLSFTYDHERWSYTQIMQSIGASLNNGEKLDTDTEVGKYFALHSFRYRLGNKLDVSYYESTVIGKRFDFAYLLPAPFMAIQGIGDSKDNTQMGLLIEFSPIDGLKWSNNFFADDISLNEAVKLNFDAKNRLGFETGLQYSPKNSSLDLMTLNYTLVTPYTYAHWSRDDDGKSFSDKTYNYFNYTNRGIQIGASIPPNSDRIGFSARFTPVKRLNVTLKTSFMRHANAYESLSAEEAEKIYKTNYISRTEGAVYVNENDGTPKNKTDYNSLTDKTNYLLVNTGRGDVYCTNSSAFAQQVFIGDDKHIDTAWDFLNFLNQDHAMTIVQTGLDLAYETPKLRLCTYTFKFGWVWEYITNNGAQNAIYTAKGRGENDTYQTAYDDWVSKLHDSMNNYLSFSVKIAY